MSDGETPVSIHEVTTFLDSRGTGGLSRYSSISEILMEVRNGRPIIMLDAEDRENQGDLMISAQFATANIVNYMATHARGLVCLAITSGRARELRLSFQAGFVGTDRHRTAFAISIEARSGVDTGISAFDRAHTVAAAINGNHSDLVSPGHVFPLIAQDGGVLARDGHTEAAVDLARLAGLVPAMVTCEMLNDDGSVRRPSDLFAFAREHGVKIGRIEDLIAYRRRTERYAANDGGIVPSLSRATVRPLETINDLTVA